MGRILQRLDHVSLWRADLSGAQNKAYLTDPWCSYRVVLAIGSESNYVYGLYKIGFLLLANVNRSFYGTRNHLPAKY